jgi:N-acetylglucosamine kinase-like BadF-type ATPase
MGQRPVPIEAAFLGLSGVVAGGRLEHAVREAAAGVVPAERIFVDTDARVAWAGALGLRPGLVAVAGTGSGVFGTDRQGRSERAGGWGYLFGDEAGAFGIAREAIRLALRQLDTDAAPTRLAELIIAHFDVRSVAEVPKAFYAGEIERSVMANLTPKLAVVAADGDDAVADLFHTAGRVLATQLVQVAERLSWEHHRVDWAPVGGVFESDSLLFEAIDRHLVQLSKLEFARMEPRFSPGVGAALLAARLGSRDRGLADAMAAALPWVKR